MSPCLSHGFTGVFLWGTNVHFYQHNIGDFNNATRHLTRIERSIYRDMLELYYDTEQPLPKDIERIARRCLVEADHFNEMLDVLNEFFELREDGYHNERADREIEAFKRMSNGGKKGAAARWGKQSTEVQVGPECPPHADPNAKHTQYPIPNTNEPIEETLVCSEQPKPKAKRGEVQYTNGFILAWEAYPKNTGSSKKDAFKAWTARVNAGADPVELLNGVKRYAAYCEALKVEPRYIKQAKTFFGTGDYYLVQWSAPKTKAPGFHKDISSMDYTKGVDDHGNF